MNNATLIALGGASGALCRYYVSLLYQQLRFVRFPYNTLTVNVLGSFLMGFLAIFLLDRVQASMGLRSFLLIGFLGSFTTFSSFSFETLHLFEQGELWSALANILLNLILCLSAVLFGMQIARVI